MVARLLSLDEPPRYRRQPRGSKLYPYKGSIAVMLADARVLARVILGRLRREGYDGRCRRPQGLSGPGASRDTAVPALAGILGRSGHVGVIDGTHGRAMFRLAGAGVSGAVAEVTCDPVESLGERLSEVCFVIMVVGVDLIEVLDAEILHPGSVVECLGNNVPRRPITLEFQDMGVTVSIEGEEIDVSAISGPYLPSDDEQIHSAHAGVLSEHVIETLF